MPRKRSKSKRIIADRSLPWSDRIAAARRAVDQIPAIDWKRGVLSAFLDEVEAELAPADSETPRDELAAVRE
jgi:hypothetical protein